MSFCAQFSSSSSVRSPFSFFRVCISSSPTKSTCHRLIPKLACLADRLLVGARPELARIPARYVLSFSGRILERWRRSSVGTTKSSNLQKSSCVFSHDPEIEEPAPSGFVADSILMGFDLNNAAPETNSAPKISAAGKFVPGSQSAATGSATSVAQEYEKEILSSLWCHMLA
ncbi:uncharacterized protein LOC124695958 [Lolium rigidum]|uniref:uncharacterized protein LOC124695958 n=1 Tax=Lolium rigidum TaxID=89674 RepID=UPI001F5D4110|nr:uncharacterized protein LOC124695958 [Lolium rigidum]